MIKSPEEIQIMRTGGRLLAEILQKLAGAVKPGLATQVLDQQAHAMILAAGAQPAFLGYDNYPATLCVSINEEVVHGLPSTRIIQPGDLVKLDLGLIYQAFNLDAAITLYARSDSDSEAQLKNKLMQVTQQCLAKGIAQAQVGKTIGDISSAIQQHAEANGFSVIRQLVGHGIGRELHEAPEVPNFGQPGQGPELVAGMTIAIEPMLSAGGYEVVENSTTLAWQTTDRSLTCHFEHTVAITAAGPEILTK